MFIASINCTELWEILNANSLTAPTDPGLASIRHDSQKSNPPCGCSRLHAHSKSICTVSGSICAWFKKTLVEWEPKLMVRSITLVMRIKRVRSTEHDLLDQG